MKLYVYMVMYLFSIVICGKKIDKDSIKIEYMEADDDFFNNLQKIRNELEKKDNKLERKKAELEELKKEIEKREKEIKIYENKISDSLESFSKKKTKKFKVRVAKLTKIFETMKPKNVAKIIENLPDLLVISVFLRLKDETIGKIMKYLPPKKAATLSEKLTQWRKKYKLKK